jgi:tetrahydromethanopterin S-methyltransferase subunit A
MAEKVQLNKIKSELQEGMGLEKCRKCGCMKQTLDNLRSSFPLDRTQGSSEVLKNIEDWLNQMEPIKYECLGCDYCYPAEAMNIFNQAFPEVAEAKSLCCGFEVRQKTWPPVAGEYFFFCDDQNCPVAVSTLASVELAERLATMRPKGLCIVGKTETENIGIDKVIKNTITNPTIRYLLLTGKDSKDHLPGKTLLALERNGVNEGMRVIGSPGKLPILRNVKKEEVEAFRRQMQVVDLIGCEDVEKINKKINLLSEELIPSSSCKERSDENKPAQISEVPVIRAEQPKKVELDKAGYFVIIPRQDKGIIIAEHYSYDNKLQHLIEGQDAKSIYWTIIENGWVTQLGHAAYLGKELAKAELSIKIGFKYIQDGA